MPRLFGLAATFQLPPSALPLAMGYGELRRSSTPPQQNHQPTPFDHEKVVSRAVFSRENNIRKAHTIYYLFLLFLFLLLFCFMLVAGMRFCFQPFLVENALNFLLFFFGFVKLNKFRHHQYKKADIFVQAVNLSYHNRTVEVIK